MKYNLNNKTNRFAQRTLAAFSDTLFFLLGKKALEKITINEICEQSNYPRATFYNYFDDIYDLMNYCWLVIGKEIQIEDYENLKPEIRTQVLFERLYNYMDEIRDKIDKILRNNHMEGKMIESLKRYMNKQILRIILSCKDSDKYVLPFEIIAEHYSNTIQLVLEWCFLRKNKLTKEEAEVSINYLLGLLEKEGNKR